MCTTHSSKKMPANEINNIWDQKRELWIEGSTNVVKTIGKGLGLVNLQIYCTWIQV